MNKAHVIHRLHTRGDGEVFAPLGEPTVDIGIDEKTRNESTDVLRKLLADEYVLYTKTRNYHWNVTGPQFAETHRFFEESYEELNGIVDEVAERIRSIGRPSPGSLAEFLHDTRIKEACGELAEADKMLHSLRDGHESIVRNLRLDALACHKRGDVGTGDFLTRLLERHERAAWMLRSHLCE